MKVNVVMPKMGESINEGTLIKWHKKKGDKVSKDEILFEISTDKVDTEIPSPEDGVLAEVKVFEQETVDVDTVVAVIETDSKNGEMPKEETKTEDKTVFKDEPTTTQVGGELVDVPMPKMGESVMEGTIIKWHKKVGEKIGRDEILFEISTDKVDTEVPSPVEGTLAEILYKENDTVEVETVVAKISTSGGIVKPKAEEAKTVPVETRKPDTKPAEIKTEQTTAKPAASNKFYSPLVMNIANKENVSYDELETIKGTGADGRVTKKDIIDYIDRRNSGEPGKVEKPVAKTVKTNVPSPQSGPAYKPGDKVEIIPMDNIRQRIMYHMVNSRDTSVHVTAVVEVDMSKVHNYIAENKTALLQKEGVKLTYMSFIAYSTIKALKQYQFLNASIDNNSIVVKKFINLGIAVAVEPNGLIVPNIKHADEKSIIGLAKAINDLSSKSRNKKLLPDDIMDGTFTITNYGVFGSLFGTPIINQPEVGILGVGAVQKRPVVISVDGVDSIAVKPMMYLALSHDHRLVDGMLGSKFLAAIKETLENFDTSLV